jgi:predicted cupin superfamily sugar epimerase
MDNSQISASYWVSHLRLAPHPEGGFFREVYRSSECVASTHLPDRFQGARAFATSIYYLLEEGDFSAFHRIKSDETWHFYAGGPLELHMVAGSNYTVVTLGNRPDRGEILQYTVPYGVWFASRPLKGVSYSLLGCTVSPGFDFADFEMGSVKEVLSERQDLHRELSMLFRS